MFIAVDGIDGSGKTTLVRQLGDILKCLNPVLTKEPTQNSQWGRKLREATLHGRLSKAEEIKLFHLDRLHHLENVIRPALKRGNLVITDRYVDSTLAFQSETPKEADDLYNAFVSEIEIPDITFILCCPVEIGLNRIKRGRESFTVFENNKTLETARVVYESRHGKNYALLDASGSPNETLLQALKVLKNTSSDLSLIVKEELSNLRSNEKNHEVNPNLKLRTMAAGN